MRGCFDAETWRGCASDRQGMRGASSRREPSGDVISVAASYLHPGNRFRKLGPPCRDRRRSRIPGMDGVPGEKKGRPPLGGGPRYRLVRVNTGPPDQPGRHQRFESRRTFMETSLAAYGGRVNAEREAALLVDSVGWISQTRRRSQVSRDRVSARSRMKREVGARCRRIEQSRHCPRNGRRAIRIVGALVSPETGLAPCGVCVTGRWCRRLPDKARFSLPPFSEVACRASARATRRTFGVPHPDTCTTFAPPEHLRTFVAATTIADAVLRLVLGAGCATAMKKLA